MQLIALGINYRSTSLALRERLAIPNNRLGDVSKKLKEYLMQVSPTLFAVDIEVVVLSTCNRTEVYLAVSESMIINASIILQCLSDYVQIDQGLIFPHAYIFYQECAVKHVFRVASGLDSMVLGETQILGQVKSAIKSANDVGTMGSFLYRLFEYSFAAAKAVRSQTEISRHSISVAAAIVRIAKYLFKDLSKKRILFIGAGQMIELCLTYFSAQKLSVMAITSRNFFRAENLANRFAAKAIVFSDLTNQLKEFDIVITCTASVLPIVKVDVVRRALLQRNFVPILMVDLAVPRDIEVGVANLRGIYSYNLDDLRSIVNVNNTLRQASVAKGEQIIICYVKQFMDWLDARSALPMIQYLQKQVDGWVNFELKQAMRRLAKGISSREVLAQFGNALSNKFLHGSRHALSYTRGDDRKKFIESLKLIFPDRKDRNQK